MSDDSKDTKEQFPAVLPPEADMAETFHWMSQRHAQRLSVPRSDTFSRKEVVAAFQSAFELIGGVPRLALWAHNNEGDFYRIYGKLLPSQSQQLLHNDGTIKVFHAIAPTILDGAEYEVTNNERERQLGPPQSGTAAEPAYEQRPEPIPSREHDSGAEQGASRTAGQSIEKREDKRAEASGTEPLPARKVG